MSRTMLKLCVVICSILSSSSSLEVLPRSDQLVDSVSSILLRSFQDPFGSVHISRAFTTLESAQLQADLVDAVIAQLNGQIVVKINSPPDEVPRRPWKWNVFLVDSYGAFVELRRELTVDKYDFSGVYLVVLSRQMNEGLLRKIFNDLRKLQIINVVVVGNTGQGVEQWTYFPFTKTGCRTVHLQKVSRIDKHELYPDKTTTFHGCLFRVGSFESRPYTIMHRSIGGKLEMGGFEGDVLGVLKEKLNFNTVIYEPLSGEQWGYALKHNSTGLMRMIQMEEVDFGISCLGISVARIEILKAGMAHHTTVVVLAVPQGRPYTPFEKLVRPFTMEVWLLISTVLLVAGFTIAVIESRGRAVREFVYGRGIRAPCLNLIQVFFGIGLPLLPTRNFARTFLFLWIYFCFVLRTLYQGAMFQHLQQDSNLPPSRTLAEIDQTDAFYYVAKSGERYFEAFPSRYQRVRHLPQEQDNLMHRLEWMEDHPEARDVVMGTLDHMAHHNRLYRRKVAEPVTICRETITTFSVAIYYPKNSMLTRQFDRQLLRIQAAGLMTYWVNRYGDYEFFGRSQGSAEPRQLSNEHLMVAYELYGLLVLVSGFVFGVELVSGRVTRRSQSTH